MDLRQSGNVNEGQFLGGLLGLAIGDALGLPLVGMTAEEIAAQHGRVTHYLLHSRDDEDAPASAEVSDETETALSLIESLTTNDGVVDPVNVNMRLGFLARGPSQQWLSQAVLNGIAVAADHDGLVPETDDATVDLAAATMGIPVGMLHALGAMDVDALRDESSTVARLTLGGKAQARLTMAVALATSIAARYAADRSAWTAEYEALMGDDAKAAEVAVVGDALEQVAGADNFETPVFDVINRGGKADAIGALTGALAGVAFGASGIPQQLIDDLDVRIYLSLAAPWFYRTAYRRAGTVIDLRRVDS